MKLYAIDDATLEIKSDKVIKETPKQYHFKGYLGTRTLIFKDDPMLAFSPEEALEKYEAQQRYKISRLQKQILFIDDEINRAKLNALR